MERIQVIDKAQGALIGSALGDAIGLYTGEWTALWYTQESPLYLSSEFMSPDQAKDAYPSGSFSLVEPVTVPHQDTHRCTWDLHD